jgi:LuxR family maltose regulon positive regulatory protein
LLVLDDFHFLASPEAQIFIANLIEYTQPYLQCFITTRNDSALLPLAKWRARGMLMEIRGNDLRFTSDEATQFLRRVMRLDLSSEQINVLLQRTEGWVVGLQLAALSVRNKEFIFTIDGAQRDITDYLMSEVFNQLPASKREFLLQTSVVNRMSSSLCNAITQREDSQSMLEAIETDNLFIVALDENREWFRYHHLFKEFLRKRLLSDYSETSVKKMNGHASHWLAQNGYITDALDHALAAKDFEYAACLMGPQSQRWMEHGEVSAILIYLNELPHEKTWNRWDLTLWYGWAYAVRGELTSAERWTNRLEELISPQIERAAQNGDCTRKQRLCISHRIWRTGIANCPRG